MPVSSTLPSRLLTVSSAKDQGSELAVHPSHCPKYFESHHSVATHSQSCPWASQQLLLVGKNKAQQRTSPCWLLCQLEKEVIINTLQEPPVLLMACCVVLPIDMVMSEVPREGEGLWMSGCSYLSLKRCILLVWLHSNTSHRNHPTMSLWLQ